MEQRDDIEGTVVDDWITEMIAVNMKILFFQGQELMFEPCRLFAQRYRTLILKAVEAERTFKRCPDPQSEAGKVLNKRFNEEFNGPVLQVIHKDGRIHDFCNRIYWDLFDEIVWQYLPRHIPTDLVEDVLDML